MSAAGRVAFAMLTGIFLAGCGSTAATSPSESVSSTPVATVPPGITISIVGSSGSQAFLPNPATAPAGQTLSFRNNSGGTHHIVADNGAWDSGTVAPNGSSSVINGSATPVSYHCTIHSSMVGSITPVP